MLKDTDEEGCTPLLLGVGSGSSDVVRLLLRHKAHVNVTTKALVYPVHTAARTGDLETLQ